MITGFQHLHSAMRWVVLALLVVTIFKAWSAKRNASGFSAGQAKLGLFSMISLHIQLLLGLALYFMKGWASMLAHPVLCRPLSCGFSQWNTSLGC